MGKSITAFIAILCMFTGLFSYAVPSQKNDVTDDKTGPSVNCAVKFAELDYVGVKFDGVARCVRASTDKEAVAKCGTRVINPGNPQYQSRISGGRIDYNPDNYYYCVENIEQNKKKNVCKRLETDKEYALKNSRYVKEQPMITFTWVPDLKTKTDGDCMCGSKGSTQKFNCDQEAPVIAKKCEAIGLKEVSGADYEQLPVESQNSYMCDCQDGRFFDVKVAKTACAEAPKPPPTPAPTPTPARVIKPYPTVADEAMKACVKAWTDQAQLCKTNSDDAKKGCNTAKSKEDKESAAAIDAARNLYTGTKANSGMQQECFTAGLAASGAKTYLGTSKDTCDASVTACETACKEDTFEAMKKACYDKIITEEQYELGNGDASPNAILFSQTEVAVREITDGASKVCTEDAKKGQSMLGSLLSGVGDALASSLRCMCQTSSGAGDCAAIPTPGACDLNPNLAGCGTYGSIAVCTPGSGYDAKLCSCQLNPKETGCPGGVASGGLSNFASPSIKSNGINDGVGTPTIAGGLKAAGAFPDLPRGTNDDAGTGTPMTLGSSPSGSAGGGVGGGLGGGGASGGGEPPAAATEAPAEEKGLGGLFNQAKTFFKDALGGKKTSPTAATKNGKSEKGFDPNKLRPTRGIASKNGIGSKNQDIWKMSNSCMYAETCPRNMNSFLEVPLKQK